MQAFEVSAPALDIIPGQDQRVLLSADQFDLRAHNVTELERIGKDIVLVRPERPLQFKRGEQLGAVVDKARAATTVELTKGPLAKAAAAIRARDVEDKLAAALAQEQAAKAEAEAKARAEAEAKARAEAEAKARAEAEAKAKAEAEAKARAEAEAKARAEAEAKAEAAKRQADLLASQLGGDKK
ncbi:hypothetical protein [Bradyrhizobium aeschynomenes]|uniref:hypothetical protein n=1 Tax=Bradyrhizobium aeschynomenes TaxID=2734909 RepID=UPI001AEF0D3B|nr:hypothetical protein [Bradyrhizobium aeschynomenes]